MQPPTVTPNYPHEPPPVLQLAFIVLKEEFWVHKTYDISAHVFSCPLDISVLQIGTSVNGEDMLVSPTVFRDNKEIITETFGSIKFPQDFEKGGDL